MKNKSIIITLLIMFVCALAFTSALAADMGYSTLTPQAGENALVSLNKNRLQLAPRLYSNITTSGTTLITGTAAGSKTAVIDSIVVNSASAGSTVVLVDGTNTLATVATPTSATVLTYNAALTSGTLSVVTTGTQNLTVTHR